MAEPTPGSASQEAAIADDTSVTSRADAKPANAVAAPKPPQAGRAAAADRHRAAAGGKGSAGSRLARMAWVLLAIVATVALCAWIALNLFERQARFADAQRLGVYRDLQANRVIEYLGHQSDAMRYLARQPLADTGVAAPADPAAALVAVAPPALGEQAAPVATIAANAAVIADAALSTGLSDLLLVEAASQRIRFARGPGFANRIDATLNESVPGDKAIIEALAATGSSTEGIADPGRPNSDFVALHPFSRVGDEAGASMAAWYSVPLQNSGGELVLLGRTEFASLLGHLNETAVDPSPFLNETPQTRLLIGTDYEGLDEALLRESLRTPVRIMAVSGEQGRPTMAALRRLEVAGNPMTLAIVQSRPTVAGLLNAIWLPLAVGLALIAIAFGTLAVRTGGAAASLPPRLTQTVRALRQGDFSARTGLRGAQDYVGLGETIDLVLEERAAAINKASRENAELNASVVRIMETVGTIAATRDLTMRVPVTEDVTGAISDALNMLTEETGRALSQVNEVAQEVARASLAVKQMGDQAEQNVRHEREEVRLAVDEVAQAATAIGQAAQEASAAEAGERRADSSSTEASHKVRATANGVLKARELIRQTEKRVKRLGEHSQEIGQVVGIIESISERTGILALNTSLQAAAAGESGRQFAGLADEVKRLSKSAGQATAQIGRMVSAIQSETAETVGAVSSAIMQVVEISTHVAQADEAMGTTRSEIEAVVERIAALSASVAEQADLSRQLQDRANQITSANVQTLAELESQSAETSRLVDCARSLIKAVGEFKTGPAS